MFTNKKGTTTYHRPLSSLSPPLSSQVLSPDSPSLPFFLSSLSLFYFISDYFFNLCGFILEEKKEVGEEEEKNKFKIGIRVWGCFAKLQVVKYFATCKKKNLHGLHANCKVNLQNRVGLTSPCKWVAKPTCICKFSIT